MFSAKWWETDETDHTIHTNAKEGSECYGFPVSKTNRKKEKTWWGVEFWCRSVNRTAIQTCCDRSDGLTSYGDEGQIPKAGKPCEHLWVFSWTKTPVGVYDTLMKNCVTFSCLYDEIQANRFFNDVIDARALFINKLVPQSPIDILRKLA